MNPKIIFTNSSSDSLASPRLSRSPSGVLTIDPGTGPIPTEVLGKDPESASELQAQIDRHKQDLADARRSLRALCEPYGIGDWPEDAHLADAIRHVAKQIRDLVHPELLRPISGPFANRECVILERREGRMRISPISESTWYNLPHGDTPPSPSPSSVADLREALIVELMRTNHSREWSVDMVRRIQAGTFNLSSFHSQEAHRLAAALLLTPSPPDLPYAGPGSPLDE